MKRLPLLFWMLCGSAGLSAAAHAQDLPSLSISDATVVEGNSRFSEVALTVSLSKPATANVTARYITKDLTAKAPSDYSPQRAGRLVIRPGQTSTTLVFRVKADTIEEADEQFSVRLQQPRGATLADGEAITTIKDDDYSGRISVGNASVSEGNSGQKQAPLSVTLSKASLHPIAVNYETQDDTAKTSLGDYIGAKGTVIIPAGAVGAPVPVLVVGDTTVERNERFLVSISAPGYVIRKRVGAVVILNDDVATPTSKGKIAFVSGPDGNPEIYVMNADGTNQTRLTFNTVQDFSPSLSGDGTKIVWVSGGAVWTMNADGSNPKKIFDREQDYYYRNPTFSPDGQKIVVAVEDTVQVGPILLLNADGTNPQVVVDKAETIGSRFSFSPDGKKIAFGSWISTQEANSRIRVVNVDGTEVTALTSGESHDSSPSFSPDGARIAYARSDSSTAFRSFM